MTTLQAIYDHIKALDPKNELKDLSCQLSFNNHLGVPGSNGDYHVGIPYHPWPADYSKYPPKPASTLGLAFKDVLENGLASVPATSKERVYIDICTLDGGWKDFFKANLDDSGPNAVSLRNVIFQKVNAIPKTATPVIRFLVGGPGPKNPDDMQKDFDDVFFSGGANDPHFDHPNLEFNLGFYSPTFKASQLKGSAESVVKVSNNLLQVMKEMGNILSDLLIGWKKPELAAKLQKVITGYQDDAMVKKLQDFAIPSISWNHAKILAVNGTTLLTGGGNFWDVYANGQSDIVDISAKIRGEATLSAHTYCDYMWRYLNNNNPTDTQSFKLQRKDRAHNWTTPIKVPLLEKTPTATANTEQGSSTVLSISKIGDWTAENMGYEFPIQMFDTARDLIVNLAAHVIRSAPKVEADDRWLALGGLMGAYTDKILEPIFEKAKITPAAWASRSARDLVIRSATKAVYIDVEIIASFLHLFRPGATNRTQEPKKSVEDARNDINQQMELTGDNAWDGVLWPWDLISAVAEIIFNPDRKVYIILTTSHFDENREDWEDRAKADGFRKRVISLMMPGNALTGDQFNERCKIKRICNDTHVKYNHCKAIGVDNGNGGKLLYIGSDNVYPNYNEEQGVWVDDSKAFDSWYNNFWKPRWDQSTDVKWDEGVYT